MAPNCILAAPVRGISTAVSAIPLILTFSMISPSSCLSQTGPGPDLGPNALVKPVELSVNTTPSEALRAFHCATGLPIFADGAPRITKVQLTAKGTAKEVLNRLSNEIDYDWKVSTSGCILLTKRFRESHEYPQINPEEMRQTIRAILAGLHTFPAEPGERRWMALLKDVGRSLTVEQTDGLERGERLKSDRLTPLQRNLLQRAILSRAYGSAAEGWEKLSAQFDGLAKGTIIAQPIDGDRLAAARYACFFVPDTRIARTAALLGEFSSASGEQTTNNASRSPKPAGTSGLPNSSLMLGEVRLDSFIAALDRMSSQAIEVHTALADRKIIVWADKMQPIDALDAVSQLEEWRVSERGGSLYLYRALPRVPGRSSEMSAYVRHVLPPDIRRFFGIPAAETADYAPTFAGAQHGVVEYVGRAMDAIKPALHASPIIASEISYSKLDNDQQELLRLALLVLAFRPTGQELWSGEPGPHQMDVDETFLTLDQREIMMVNVPLKQGGSTGFGVNVKRP